MDEKVLRNARHRTVEEEMAVNDMYLDAITAKLKLLDRIWLLRFLWGVFSYNVSITVKISIIPNSNSECLNLMNFNYIQYSKEIMYMGPVLILSVCPIISNVLISFFLSFRVNKFFKI